MRIYPPPTHGQYVDSSSSKRVEPYCDNWGWDPHRDIGISGSGTPVLCGDTAVNSITYRGDWPNGWIVNLAGHSLYLGEGGFKMIGNDGGLRFFNGYISSLVGMINISFKSSDIGFALSIRDNDSIKVGLNITEAGERGVHIYGNQPNTFTGDLNVIGNSRVTLYKTSGVISISGNLNIRSGAVVEAVNSGQFAKHVRVTLQSTGAGSQLILDNGVREAFHELVVDGHGIIAFRGRSELILDDLTITDWGKLSITEWDDTQDVFLVRKGSAHVEDALERITFNGKGGLANLKDYNQDYWRISSTPEPATYGALLSVFGVAVVMVRRRRKVGKCGNSKPAKARLHVLHEPSEVA